MHYPHKISKVKRARKLGFRARMKTTVFVVVCTLTDANHRDEEEQLRLWLSLLQNQVQQRRWRSGQCAEAASGDAC